MCIFTYIKSYYLLLNLFLWRSLIQSSTAHLPSHLLEGRKSRGSHGQNPMREVSLKDSKRDEGTKIVFGGPSYMPHNFIDEKTEFQEVMIYIRSHSY